MGEGEERKRMGGGIEGERRERVCERQRESGVGREGEREETRL